MGTKPFYTPEQVTTQLTTSWGDYLTGSMLSWPATQTTISYSINSGTPTNKPDIPVEGGTYLVNMSSIQVAAAQLSFQLWDDLIAKAPGTQHRLVQSALPSANITLDYSSNTNNWTYTSPLFTPDAGTINYTIQAAQIWLSSNTQIWPLNADIGMPPGLYGSFTMIHEIGHSLGLSHPGVYDSSSGLPITYATDAVFFQDSRKYTVESYFGGYLPGSGWQVGGPYYMDELYPQTPMVYDIYAIQAKYGADTTTRKGNTVYGYHCNLPSTDPERVIYDFTINHSPIFTIWDAGGTDTLDCSGYSGSQTINLTPGSYSSVNGMIENVAIAFNCSIEKAIGGAGNDTLIAVGKNTLTGGAGVDTFLITAGTNTITDLAYGNVSDIISVANYATVTAKAVGNFTATSETINNGTAFINANGHAVSLSMAGGSNGWTITNESRAGAVLIGSSNNDTITGGSGNDTLTGGAGIDRFNITEGIDTVTDLAYGNVSDILVVSRRSTAIVTAAGNFTATSATINNGTSSINANGHAVNMASAGGSNGWTITNASGTGVTLIGSSHDDTITGGSGNDTLTGGSGSDKFVFNTTPNINTNHDIITDFKHGTDILQLSKTAFPLITNWKMNEFYSGANAVAAHDSSDRIIYNTTTGNLYYDQDGSGSAPLVLVALIGTVTHPSLTYSDIQLVA